MTHGNGSPQQKVKFQRALMLADRKAFDKALPLFRDVVDLDPETIVACQAAVSLGELLTYSDEEEAQNVLEAALTHMEAYPGEPLLEWDRERATELLAALAEA